MGTIGSAGGGAAGGRGKTMFSVLGGLPLWLKTAGSVVATVAVILPLLIAFGVIRPVPEVFNQDGTVAYNQLVADGFKVQIVYESSGVEKGKVIKTQPAGNSNVLNGSTVTLYVSSGLSSGAGASPPATVCSFMSNPKPFTSPITGFEELTFPSNTVAGPPAQKAGAAGQFLLTEYDICVPNASVADVTGSPAGHLSIVGTLLGKGWSQGAIQAFPYDGELLAKCSVSTCLEFTIQNTSAQPPRYIEISQVVDRGTAVTFHLRLASPPLPPACDSQYSALPYTEYLTPTPAFRTTNLYDGIALPPLTKEQQSSLYQGLLSAYFCSSGPDDIVSRVMDDQLAAHGFRLRADTNCAVGEFAKFECWSAGPQDKYDFMIGYDSGHGNRRAWSVVYHDPDI